MKELNLGRYFPNIFKKEIEEVGKKISGIVLNKVEISKSDYNNHYKYYTNRKFTNNTNEKERE